MSKAFKSIITKAGREKIAAAIVNGSKVFFSQMSVGDGAGNATTPGEEQASLVNERFRTQPRRRQRRFAAGMSRADNNYIITSIHTLILYFLLANTKTGKNFR